MHKMANALFYKVSAVILFAKKAIMASIKCKVKHKVSSAFDVKQIRKCALSHSVSI